MSDAPQGREVARRLFAAEFEDATLSYSESDEERAPNYVVTPTGARTNRLFAVGALTEVDSVSEDVLRGRVADPTGVFVTYAGQYQPDAAAFLERASPPCFVSLTGKARTYQPDHSDRIFTSVRPESLNEVDADTRDRWVVAAAEATLHRIATTAAALALDVRGDDLRAALASRGVDGALAEGVALAVDHYEPTEHYLEAVRRMAIEALELVADERDSVTAPSVSPDASGPDELGPLPTVPASSSEGAEPSATSAESDPTAADDSTESAPGSPDETAAPASTGTATDDDGEASVERAVDASESIDDSGPSDDGTAAELGADAPADETAETDTASESPDSDAEPADDLGDFGTQPSAGSDDGFAGADDDGIDGADDGFAGTDDDGIDTPLDEEGMYELDEEEREEIESEYGTEFATGNEVDEPGEADIDVPDPEELESMAEEATGSDPAPEPSVDAGTGADAASGGDATPADETTDDGAIDADETAAAVDESAPSADSDGGQSAADLGDVDLEDAAVSVMADLDDGDGADHEAVVAAVVEEYGADPDDVEDAIQEALMGGKCYEPSEGTLKAI